MRSLFLFGFIALCQAGLTSYYFKQHDCSGLPDSALAVVTDYCGTWGHRMVDYQWVAWGSAKWVVADGKALILFYNTSNCNSPSHLRSKEVRQINICEKGRLTKVEDDFSYPIAQKDTVVEWYSDKCTTVTSSEVVWDSKASSGGRCYSFAREESTYWRLNADSTKEVTGDKRNGYPKIPQ